MEPTSAAGVSMMRGLRRCGVLLLLLSLLGWSAWWVICNVYEFAPRLDTAALVCAWASALMAVAGRLLRRPRWSWALAGLNGAYLLAVHRQIDAGLGPAVFGAVLLGLFLVMVWQGRRQKRPASLPAV